MRFSLGSAAQLRRVSVCAALPAVRHDFNRPVGQDSHRHDPSVRPRRDHRLRRPLGSLRRRGLQGLHRRGEDRSRQRRVWSARRRRLHLREQSARRRAARARRRRGRRGQQSEARQVGAGQREGFGLRDVGLHRRVHPREGRTARRADGDDRARRH